MAGAMICSVVAGLFNPDQMRAGIEGLSPIAYSALQYGEKWLHTLETNLVRGSALNEQEIEERFRLLCERPSTPLPRRTDPEGLATIEWLIANGAPLVQSLDQEPAFEPDDRVRTREIRVEDRGSDHTRLPGYAQLKEGVVAIRHPPMPLPDAGVHGEMRVEHLYAVRFRASDLWEDSDDSASVCVDLWESYLEPA